MLPNEFIFEGTKTLSNYLLNSLELDFMFIHIIQLNVLQSQSFYQKLQKEALYKRLLDDKERQKLFNSHAYSSKFVFRKVFLWLTNYCAKLLSLNPVLYTL